MDTVAWIAISLLKKIKNMLNERNVLYLKMELEYKPILEGKYSI